MENSRYYRQLLLPEVGEEGQQKIREAKVLLVGLGGLGSPVSMYLVGAGIGKLGIVDYDVVSLNNLPRQVLYSTAQIGLPKVVCAAERLKSMNPEVEIVTYNQKIDKTNVIEIVSQYDIVVDGCDNFVTRYLLSDTCRLLSKPLVHGAIRGLEGQVAVLCGNAKSSYRTLFPDEREVLEMPHPGRQILGTTPGFTAMIQVTEVIKLICGFGDSLKDKLLTFDLSTMQFNVIDLC